MVVVANILPGTVTDRGNVTPGFGRWLVSAIRSHLRLLIWACECNTENGFCLGYNTEAQTAIFRRSDRDRCAKSSGDWCLQRRHISIPSISIAKKPLMLRYPTLNCDEIKDPKYIDSNTSNIHILQYPTRCKDACRSTIQAS
ncbi:hypothetical protein VTI28DRAFT_2139 [Corynascus sepedonium]